MYWNFYYGACINTTCGHFKNSKNYNNYLIEFTKESRLETIIIIIIIDNVLE